MNNYHGHYKPQHQHQHQHQQLCNSCRLTFPNQVPSNTTCMRTLKVEPCLPSAASSSSATGGGGCSTMPVAYLSTQYPADPRRFMAIHQACLQMLSSEHTFNDSTPLMISDPGLGAAMGLVFKVHDESSRGHVRKYALICLCDHEQLLMGAWNLVVASLTSIKTSIQKRAAAPDGEFGYAKAPHQQQQQQPPQQQQQQQQPSYGIPSVSNISPSTPDRFLRKRDSRVPPKSLTVILKDDRFFGEIHAKFTYLLSMLNKRYMFP